jgi:hypothetical protein
VLLHKRGVIKVFRQSECPGSAGDNTLYWAKAYWQRILGGGFSVSFALYIYRYVYLATYAATADIL